jgi:hypothetical protein
MAFREVSVVGVKEVLRLWLRGHGQRTIAGSAQLDRKTVRRWGLRRRDPDADHRLASLIKALGVKRE